MVEQSILNYTPLLGLVDNVKFKHKCIMYGTNPVTGSYKKHKISLDYNSLFLKHVINCGTSGISSQTGNIVHFGLQVALSTLIKEVEESATEKETTQCFLHLLPPQDKVKFINTCSEGIYFFIDEVNCKAWLELTYEYVSVLEES